MRPETWCGGWGCTDRDQAPNHPAALRGSAPPGPHPSAHDFRARGSGGNSRTQSDFRSTVSVGRPHASRHVARTACLAVLFSAVSNPVGAGEAAPPIQDNSFTVEEAYNQEPGVVQHIFAASRDDRGRVSASFTQEWPVAGQRHQLGFTATYSRFPVEGDLRRGPGDLLLHYRVQALGGGTTRIALAPRASLIVPTGDETEGLGGGAWGIQGNLPLSVRVGRRFVLHSNAGFNWMPALRSESGDEANAFGWFAGQSLVWLAQPRVNVLLETLYASDEVVVASRRTERENSLFVTPGVRFALNFPSGMQIVPAVAATFGFADAHGENAVLCYLSVELPYRD